MHQRIIHNAISINMERSGSMYRQPDTTSYAWEYGAGNRCERSINNCHAEIYKHDIVKNGVNQFKGTMHRDVLTPIFSHHLQ